MPQISTSIKLESVRKNLNKTWTKQIWKHLELSISRMNPCIALILVKLSAQSQILTTCKKRFKVSQLWHRIDSWVIIQTFSMRSKYPHSRLSLESNLVWLITHWRKWRNWTLRQIGRNSLIITSSTKCLHLRINIRLRSDLSRILW